MTVREQTVEIYLRTQQLGLSNSNDFKSTFCKVLMGHIERAQKS